ncbi:hypothetical protein [Streptomyces sp. C10]|uniref:hypothetical protein n=1 Tax=Streptomyces sp. C10 TaxID=531941 RepID=UPI00397FB2B7
MQGPRRRSSPISAADLPILEDHRNGGNRDQSEAFSITTGISISYGAGASLGFLSASNQISVSLELGYESRREVSFFRAGWLDPAPDIDFELLAKSEPPAGAVDPAPENANAS